ncbi:hypothetical protein Cgig2_009375 [Carnegiea gigantea]|uniref:SHSP domain-containing protein n=1 Tax=Carnegiea gigantea TaxID=171969 RepID=A0A9Q1JH01_9CARY|nr:hypothetical protein Cgig2_009375 [Carnegiea gigantea]
MALIPSFFGSRKTNVFDPFSLDVWDPFEGFLSSALSNVQPSSAARETSQFVSTRVDWKETPEAHIFKVDVPGVKKEEVKVEVEEGRILQISGERTKEQEEKNDKWHRVERASGKFLRRFRLPENAKMDEVKATIENGVLTVTVPKVEEKKPEPENHAHLLYQRHYSKNVLQNVPSTMQTPGSILQFRHIIMVRQKLKKSSIKQKVFCLCITGITYYLGQERNTRRFQQQRNTVPCKCQ